MVRRKKLKKIISNLNEKYTDYETIIKKRVQVSGFNRYTFDENNISILDSVYTNFTSDNPDNSLGGTTYADMVCDIAVQPKLSFILYNFYFGQYRDKLINLTNIYNYIIELLNIIDIEPINDCNNFSFSKKNLMSKKEETITMTEISPKLNEIINCFKTKNITQKY